MSGTYDPDSSIAVVSPWTTVHLSNRDLAGQVPINFVTHPSVALSVACFGNKVYEADAATKCFSNLLAIQYQRIIVDLYWDSNLRDFFLCPVAIPRDKSGNVPATTATPPPSAATSAVLLSSAMLSDGTPKAASSSTPAVEVKRQDSTSSASPSSPGSSSSTLVSSTSANNSSSTSTTSSVPPTIPTSLSPSGETLYSLGPYQCTATLDLGTIISVFLDYIHNTETTLTANLLYMDVNLHAAADSFSPLNSAAAPSRSDLPTGSDLVGSQFNDAMSQYIYGPGDLESERADLNRSWYSVIESRAPISEYFSTVVSDSGIHSTPDGWPCEDYIEITKGNRALLSWGIIDPQMQGYNFSADASTMFPPNYLLSGTETNVTADGNVTAGCYYNSTSYDVASANSSWAVSDAVHGFQFPLHNSTDSLAHLSTLPSNLSTCGISPFLNRTLFNVTASTDPRPYQNVSYSSVWSWAEGEPRNTSRLSEEDDGDSPKLFRCALMDITEPFHGRWRVEDCSAHYPVACRIGNQPYNWTITPFPVIFSAAAAACSDNQTFGVPRTGLENAYLHAYALSMPRDQLDPGATNGGSKSGVWVNFNSLDMQACWVSGGPNATCPYFVDSKNQQRREVLIPTIAAIIVLILTALTLFVKCNVNRRMSRRRKRGEGGWDYEGVPS